jgi:hypothetical protein
MLHFQKKDCRVSTKRWGCSNRLPNQNSRDLHSFRHYVRQCRYFGLSSGNTVGESPKFPHARSKQVHFCSKREPVCLWTVLSSGTYPAGQAETPTDILTTERGFNNHQGAIEQHQHPLATRELTFLGKALQELKDDQGHTDSGDTFAEGRKRYSGQGWGRSQRCLGQYSELYVSHIADFGGHSRNE